MIDLDQFTTDVKVLAPVTGGKFQHRRKKYDLGDSAIEGWSNVVLQGNQAKYDSPAFLNLDQTRDFDIVKGYTYNNNLVFFNFDVGRRKTGKEIQTELLFNNFPTFTSVEAVLWEDHNIYVVHANYTDFKIYEIKALFDASKGADLKSIKGVTPELRTLYLFHEIQRNQFLALQAKELAASEREEWLKSIPGRIQQTFKNAGAEIINLSFTGNRAVVDWKLSTTGRAYNSVIDTNTFIVIEAGYCMSADDSRHNITSMVQLADDYETLGVTFVTRNRGDQGIDPVGPHFDEEDEDY